MSMKECFRMSLTALRANKMRAALTMLGVIIGVAAVIMLVSLGMGSKNQIGSGIEDIGSNLIMVIPGNIELDMSMGQQPSDAQGNIFSYVNRLTPAMAEDIKDVLPENFRVAPMSLDMKTVKFGSREVYTQCIGSTQDYFDVRGHTIEKGTNFTRQDMARPVCVLGSEVAEALFGAQDPVGRDVAIANRNFRVIGVTAPKGKSFFLRNDDAVFIPSEMAVRYFGNRHADNILIKAPSSEDVAFGAEMSEKALLKRLEEDEFTVFTQEEIASFANDIMQIMTYLSAALGGISLLVGGIGIMNIMLVSVTERTREIGIRKAIGAKTKDIMAQFLVESVVISLIGGFIGIVVALIGAQFAGDFLGIPPAITTWLIALAFLFSMSVGVFFGVYPATKAAKLDPIMALRYE